MGSNTLKLAFSTHHGKKNKNKYKRKQRKNHTIHIKFIAAPKTHSFPFTFAPVLFCFFFSFFQLGLWVSLLQCNEASQRHTYPVPNATTKPTQSMRPTVYTPPKPTRNTSYHKPKKKIIFFLLHFQNVDRKPGCKNCACRFKVSASTKR